MPQQNVFEKEAASLDDGSLVMEIIDISAAAFDKFAAEQDRQRAELREVSALIPDVAEHLVKSAMIQPHEEREARRALCNPVFVLQLLKQAAIRVQETPAHQSGKLPSTETPGATKIASAPKSLFGASSAADQAFEQVMTRAGLPTY